MHHCVYCRYVGLGQSPLLSLPLPHLFNSSRFHFTFFFFKRERNFLEYFHGYTDTQAGLVLNMLLTSDVTLISGFQITLSFPAINIIQSRYVKIMGKILVRRKSLALTILCLCGRMKGLDEPHPCPHPSNESQAPLVRSSPGTRSLTVTRLNAANDLQVPCTENLSTRLHRSPSSGKNICKLKKIESRITGP